MKVKQIFREKEILILLSTKENTHPLIIHLFCTFQDTDSLYFVMTLAPCKDLLTKIKKLKNFTSQQAQFVAGEILLALGIFLK